MELDEHWDWVNPNCGLAADLGISEVPRNPKRYQHTIRIKETFPIEYGDWWNVKDGYGRVVEIWRVEYVNDKNTLADVTVTQYHEDENDPYRA